jgi:uncharacterized protein YPO0396
MTMTDDSVSQVALGQSVAEEFLPIADNITATAELAATSESATTEESKTTAEESAEQTAPALNGFRLKYLELYNWGTFDGQVCRLCLYGKNGLLTGDIGSGKSTVVDAITTLLVPANRVAYNKAAGADIKERHLRSYVQGYYKTERNDLGGSAKPVALRDSSSYTVLLGVFENPDFEQSVTLAQVFWIKDPMGQPQRFFVGAEKELAITTDFSNFGSDINKLRKLLRGKECEIFDTFPAYGAWFRRRFGIDNEQALELFHQTVSMKSVGNLTDFVRSHMLEPQNVQPQIEALIRHFEDLNSAHEAVLKASKQVDMLTPLVADCQKHDTIQAARNQLVANRDALETYFIFKKVELLDKRIKSLGEEHTAISARIERNQEKVNKQKLKRDDLKQTISENGGNRLSKLATEIDTKEREQYERKRRADRYSELASALGLTAEPDEAKFAQQQASINEQRELMKENQAIAQNSLTDNIVQLRQIEANISSLKSEIDSLKQRKSNIPRNQILIRQQLCQAIGLREEELPFAGELLQVKESEQSWEGAAERAMHSFALAMLVPDKQYALVADFVDRTHLGGRLIYYRVRQQRPVELPSTEANSLAGKLDIKHDTPFYDWLENEITRRFDLACCSTQEEFRRYSKAITQAGQIKSKDDRHDKDDRHRIDDRSRYVLGWSNAEKLRVLEAQESALRLEGRNLAKTIAQLNEQKGELDSAIDQLSRLEEYKSHKEIDWLTVAEEIKQLTAELKEIETSSNMLKELSNQLSTLEIELANSEQSLSEQKDQRVRVQERLANCQRDHKELSEQTQSEFVEEHKKSFGAIESLHKEVHGDVILTIETCNGKEQSLRVKLQSKIDHLKDKLGDLENKIVVSMQKYRGEFPVDTTDVDASIGAADEYKEMLAQLQADDLPRFRQRFKELLNENTIREVANFQMHLHRERENIKERISNINESLTQIDYNIDRFIRLEAEPSQDADIRAFQVELRACTEGAFTGSEESQYSEEKFLQVKAIIERFRGREGQSEIDRKWTSRVTDVRNWYTFAASERWREANIEHEHYSDSGGKSGGQKEKLAYTILAASLAYQFGLSWGESRSRSFRFVVIDEAFGRGSDDSAKYGLTLFEKLNLQLLVVTPMQKIAIIEPFVASVGFVSNEEGRASRLRNLTIQEYREEKSKRALWSGLAE